MKRRKMLHFIGTIAAVTAAMAAIPSGARAGQTTTFDFENVDLKASDSQISAYMSSLYGSSVTVSKAQSDNNLVITIWGLQIPLDPEPWTGNPGQFLFADVQEWPATALDITFNEIPISSVSFDGFVFRENYSDDFHFKAFDAKGSEVTARAFQEHGGFSSGLITFDRPVTTLRFSDNLIHDIGIDNLTVAAAPEPTTFISGLFGITLAGFGAWRRRRARSAASDRLDNDLRTRHAARALRVSAPLPRVIP